MPTPRHQGAWRLQSPANRQHRPQPQEHARVIAKERSRREIQPVIKTLKEVCSIKDDGTEKTKELIKQTKALHDLADTADTMLNKLVNQNQNWLTKSLLKLFS